MNNNLATIRDEVSRIAVSAGNYLKEEQRKMSRSVIEFKGTRNYVTYVDKTAEKQLVRELKKLLPEAGFLTEESTVEFVKNEYVWIIDPLDGTTNYIHGDTPYAVSIALMQNDKIVLGVVYDPVAGELYSATGKEDVSLNGNPIKISEQDSLTNAYIGFGIPYSLDKQGEQILRNTLGQFKKCSFRIKGSAAMEICYVASGRSDAYFHSGLSPWDVAAATFILACAGGKNSDFSGGADYIFGKELVASNGKIHQELLEEIICKQAD